MAIRRVLLGGTGTSGDGSTWNDLSDATSAFIGMAGLDAAVDASADGDTVYAKGTHSASVSLVQIIHAGLSGNVNPVRMIAVRTDAGDTVVKTDVILGLREGDATRAYAQTGAEAPPLVDQLSNSDITFDGGLYCYGFVFQAADDIGFGFGSGTTCMTFEECEFKVTGAGDLILFGGTSNANPSQRLVFRNCRFDAASSNFMLVGPCRVDFFDCEFDGTGSAGFGALEFTGIARFHGCNLSGCPAILFNISDHQGSLVELWNCKPPASHVLTGGTATEFYTVANYGSEDNTGLDSADSEQAFEIHTHQGTVDIETTAVRTGGADDEATDSGGPFAVALTPNNVTDNFVGVVSPWFDAWALGDGAAKTLTVYIANGSASTDLQDDEVSLEVMFPDEAGGSIYKTLPDEGAPGDGGGRMQLLGTAADLTDDTGSTWGSGANNHQKLTQSIAPDYRGAVRARVHYSKSSGPVLYVDPVPTLA